MLVMKKIPTMMPHTMPHTFALLTIAFFPSFKATWLPEVCQIYDTLPWHLIKIRKESVVLQHASGGT